MSQTAIRSFPVLGTPVAVGTYPEIVSQIVEWAVAGDRAYAVEAADVHVIARARTEEPFRQAIERFDLVCPDGMPLVWTLNADPENDRRQEGRLSGAEIMLSTLRDPAATAAGSHFLLGGSEQLLGTLTAKIAELAPAAKIAASYSPPFGNWPETETERIGELIRQSGARYVWVGLGCPKQERWIGDHLRQLPPAVYFGVGAAFAFHAGTVARAPSVLQNLGLEWAYRIAREPRRLFKRYLVYNSRFVFYSLLDHARGR